MSRKKKKGRKNPEQKVLLATVIVQLISAIIDLIEKLIE